MSKTIKTVAKGKVQFSFIEEVDLVSMHTQISIYVTSTIGLPEVQKAFLINEYPQALNHFNELVQNYGEIVTNG